MEALEDQGIGVKKFIARISTYEKPTVVQRKSLKSLKEESSQTDLSDIFSIFNEHLVWSFLDFALLKFIVKQWGSNELKCLLKAYSNKMKEFRRRTKAVTLIAVWDEAEGEIHQCNECKKVFVRLNANPDECTLHDLNKIRKNACRLLRREGLRRELNLTEAALVLYRVKYGSTELIWIVHVRFVPEFKEAFRECVATGVFFKANGISRLEIDGEVFSPNEPVSVML